MSAIAIVGIRDAKFRPGGPVGPKVQARPGFLQSLTKSAGLMPGSGQAITMYYALAARLRVVLERCWPGSMLGSADFIW